MFKIGQNVIVETPNRWVPGVIHDITRHGERGELYWVRVGRITTLFQRAFPFTSTGIKPLEPSPHNPSPKHFSVGNRVSINGERWEIISIIEKSPEKKYVVQNRIKHLKVVTSADFS